jgi:hypothetical protein
MRVTTGTLWHEKVYSVLDEEGVEYQRDIDVTPGLPYGWTGSADLIYSNDLIDIKTTTKDKIAWLSNPKATPLPKYTWQVSAYYHGLSAMGYWLGGAYILYVPIDGGHCYLKPVDVIDRDKVWERMALVSDMVTQDSLPPHEGYNYKVTTVKSRKVHELYQIPPVYASWCKFKDCECQDMEKKIVASLTFKGEYEGPENLRPIMEKELAGF